MSVATIRQIKFHHHKHTCAHGGRAQRCPPSLRAGRFVGRPGRDTSPPARVSPHRSLSAQHGPFSRCLNSIYCWTRHVFSIRSSADGHRGCSHLLTRGQSVNTFLCGHVFTSLGHMPGKRPLRNVSLSSQGCRVDTPPGTQGLHSTFSRTLATGFSSPPQGEAGGISLWLQCGFNFHFPDNKEG